MRPNRSMPAATVVPVLTYPDVRQAVAWLTAVMEPTDFEYGERQCTVHDPVGHDWTFSQTLRDVRPEEWGGEAIGGD